MFRFPVITDETGNKKFSAIFGGLRESLVQQEGVSHWAVDHTVEDVCEGLALVE